MKPCPDYQETLYLEVYGELDEAERPAWEKHLSTCGQCRKEREALLRLLETVKVTMPQPVLSRKQADELASAIIPKLSNLPERERRKQLFGVPGRLIPALATASFLLIVLSWISLKEFKMPALFPKASNLTLEEQVSPKDMDVIKNLELLKEMDDIEKLVQRLDKSTEPGDLSIKRKLKSQYGGGHA